MKQLMRRSIGRRACGGIYDSSVQRQVCSARSTRLCTRLRVNQVLVQACASGGDQASTSVPESPDDAAARRQKRQQLRQARQAVTSAAEEPGPSSSIQDDAHASDRSADGASTSGNAPAATSRVNSKRSIGSRRAAVRARSLASKGRRSAPAEAPSSSNDASQDTPTVSRSTGSDAMPKPLAAAGAAAGMAEAAWDEQQRDDEPAIYSRTSLRLDDADDVVVDADDSDDDTDLLEAAEEAGSDDEELYEDEGEDSEAARAAAGAGAAAAKAPKSATRPGPQGQPRQREQVVLKESHPMYLPVLTDDDLAEDPPGHKSGYVAIIGRPNAGKSTLINGIVGQKLSIVTFKAQTTRHRVVGIASEPQYQMILFDTPGIVRQQRNALEERMMAAVVSSIRAAEAIIAVVDAADNPKEALAMFQPGNDWNGPPMAVLLNKADLLQPEELQELAEWYKTNCKAQVVFAGSALEGGSNEAVAAVKAWAVEKLPEGPTLYPKDMVSEQPERFFVSEIIREKIFLQYEQEIPYSVQVTIPEFKERPGQKDFIAATILVERDTQKGIIIGAGGAAIRKLGAAARTDIEAFLERPVYLELKVEVAPDWRNKNESLKQYGFYDPLYIT